MSAQVSVTLSNPKLKELAMKKARAQGLSLKAVITALLEDYIARNYSFRLIPQEESVKDTSWEQQKKAWEESLPTLEISEEEIKSISKSLEEKSSTAMTADELIDSLR